MSHSYIKTLKCYPAHCKCSNIGKLSWKKTYRQRVNKCCDIDGTPILPHKINMGWPLSHGGGKKGSFGYDTYTMRVYNIIMVGGKPVSTIPDGEEPWPGYIKREFRRYKNK